MGDKNRTPATTRGKDKMAMTKETMGDQPLGQRVTSEDLRWTLGGEKIIDEFENLVDASPAVSSSSLLPPHGVSRIPEVQRDGRLRPKKDGG